TEPRRLERDGPPTGERVEEHRATGTTGTECSKSTQALDGVVVWRHRERPVVPVAVALELDALLVRLLDAPSGFDRVALDAQRPHEPRVVRLLAAGELPLEGVAAALRLRIRCRPRRSRHTCSDPCARRGPAARR